MNYIKRINIWKIFTIYYFVIDKILPRGTRRRYAYDLGTMGSKKIANFGTINFLIKFKKKILQFIMPPSAYNFDSAKSYLQRNVDEIMSNGERVTHLYPNDCYYGHLSIYYFALQFSTNNVVLDAGSGAGYGSVYLADHGAKFVWGIDISPKAIKFSRHYFKRNNVKFKAMDIERISGFSNNYFDFIFTSNALEHISNVPAFLHSAWKLLKPEGTMLVAVPPITNEEARKVDSANPYHLNIWSPRQWYNEFKKFFLDIQLYRHGFENDGIKLDFGNTPDQTHISEKDFIFKRISLEQFPTDSITAIFILRKPVSENELPSQSSPITFVDGSYTRSSEIS